MDGWQAAQNWLLFGVVAAAAIYYYYPQAPKNKPQTLNKASGAQRAEERPGKIGGAQSKDAGASRSQQKANKRPAAAAPGPEPVQAYAAEDIKEKGVEDSNRAFAQSMLKARQGVDVKKPQSTGDRVKTVRSKNAEVAPASVAAASSVADFDDGEWSQVTSSQIKSSSGVDDMLEAPAPGPTALRITASTKPMKEKAPKQAKQEVVETKKQRQNRQKVEQRQAQREEEERERKALEERQRRTAREARGEPAKNGLASAPAPKNSAWNGRSAAPTSAVHETQPQTSSNLLDTFDAESTASSNDAQVSTAATSTTDGATAHWSDEPFQPDDLTKSMVETGPWNEVKKKQKKKGAQVQDTNGSVTPVGAPLIVNGSAAKAPKALSKPKATGFAALKDDMDPNDASNW